jgi:hypothetical protein
MILRDLAWSRFYKQMLGSADQRRKVAAFSGMLVLNLPHCYGRGSPLGNDDFRIWFGERTSRMTLRLW